MARGPKLHLKRIAAPKHWCLDKLGGVFAPRPTPGPHKLRECMPMILLLRNKLKYALSYTESKMIAVQRCVKVDGKIRTDVTFPIGFMDVVQIEKTKEQFRLLYNTKGRFVPHRIHPDEATYKLCRVKKVGTAVKGVPYAVTHDGRMIRYVHPDVKVNDVVRIDIATGKVLDFLKFEVGKKAMVTGGHSIGRVGVIVNRERHPGSTEIIHLKDARGQTFATKVSNVFVVGTSEKFWVTLPPGEGIKKSIIEEQAERLQRGR